jgi:hypothetical protein
LVLVESLPRVETRGYKHLAPSELPLFLAASFELQAVYQPQAGKIFCFIGLLALPV